MLHALFVWPVRGYFRHGPWHRGTAVLWRIASHTWRLKTVEDVRTECGATLRVDARDVVGRYLSCFGVWEPNLTAWLRQTLQPGHVFVDVGANVGYSRCSRAGSSADAAASSQSRRFRPRQRCCARTSPATPPGT